ncbi:DUF6694 family lipoprotein [Desulfobaculum bizertense]|uniref:Lipoprotein n=1 Tax=Desulfobaculum bizertense DSM 18034 TaxID=1121442 RepID=A0A1T4X346_9BACT|nr:DUF6694 family lipoprotein [Desulfobaculum bizertense]SKA84034.1 hypothetical protein SAMN02745702_02952 [Desulfobaculum bizertense DSM 18034]
MKKLLAALLCTLALVGCFGGPTIDGSSKENFEKSTDAIMETLDADQRAEFSKALKIVAFSSIDFGKVFQGALDGKMPSETMLYKELDGLNAQEVIEKAQQIMDSKKQK